MSESPFDTIKRQSQVIDEQAVTIERVEKERDEWQAKWMALSKAALILAPEAQ